MSKQMTTLLIAILSGHQLWAAANVSAAARAENIRKGEVWNRPAWIQQTNDGFSFNNSQLSPQDIREGSPVSAPNDVLLLQSPVRCEMTEETAAGPDGTGQTPKFLCHLYDQNRQKVSGEGRTIKVKYLPNNGEIYGEVMASRLMWALGFGSDRMFFVDQLQCFACSQVPHQSRRVQPDRINSPITFSPVAIERKFPGEAIKSGALEGWGFDELMRLTSHNPAEARRQKIQRDALRLIATFLQHVDNKPANQRLVCQGTVDTSGNCVGSVKLLVQDVGATFGGGTRAMGFDINKAKLDDWTAQGFWKTPGNCVLNMAQWQNQSLAQAQVSEEGRQFAVKLLEAFAANQERVSAVFESAQIERRTGRGSLAGWVAEFNNKINQMKNPRGTCPSIDHL